MRFPKNNPQKILNEKWAGKKFLPQTPSIFCLLSFADEAENFLRIISGKIQNLTKNIIKIKIRVEKIRQKIVNNYKLKFQKI